MATQSWREGPALPANLKDLTYVQLSDGFLAIGGLDGDSTVNTVYKFNQDIYEWVLLDTHIGIPRAQSAAAAIPSSLLDCD